MKKEKLQAMDVDELLKETLKDDLPAEAEPRMKMRFAEFREKADEPGHRTATRPAKSWRKLFLPEYSPAAVRWIFNRQALALLSVFMLAVGGFLQATGQRSVLAESLTSLRTSVSVAANTRQSGSMECRAHVAVEEGVPSDYVLRWIQPGMARVDVQKAGEVRETLWITDGEFIVTDHLKNTSQKFANLEQLRNSVFQPVMDFISPARLAGNMEHGWRLERFEQKAGSRQGTFIFLNHEKGTHLEMTVDLDSYLPIRISRLRPSTGKGGPAEELMRLDFTWSQPDSDLGVNSEILRKKGNP